MQSIPANRNRRLTAFLAAILLCAALLAAMCALNGVNPRDYPYRSYLLQAQAWLRGETARIEELFAIIMEENDAS